jgi:hypothetical protein
MCQQILLQPSIAKFHVHMFNSSRVIAREQKEQIFEAFATGIMKPKGSHWIMEITKHTILTQVYSSRNS